MINLYQQELMDHYKNPRHYGTLPDADVVSDEHNPSCGDSIQMAAKLNQMTVVALAFTGKGCVISQAAASMLAELCLGKTVQEIEQLDAQTMQELVGIPLGPTRLKCALLALQALKQGLKRYAESR